MFNPPTLFRKKGEDIYFKNVIKFVTTWHVQMDPVTYRFGILRHVILYFHQEENVLFGWLLNLEKTSNVVYE